MVPEYIIERSRSIEARRPDIAVRQRHTNGDY